MSCQADKVTLITDEPFDEFLVCVSVQTLPRRKRGEAMRQPRIKTERLQALNNGSAITGIPVDELLDEALQQYIEANLSVLIEAAAERSATA